MVVVVHFQQVKKKMETSDTIMDTTSSISSSTVVPKPPPPQNFAYQVTVLSRLMEHADIITDLHTTADSYPFALTASMDQTLKIWNLEKGGFATQTLHSSAPVLCARFSSTDSSLLVSGYQDGRARVWDTRTPGGKGLRKPTLSLPLGSPVYCTVWHPAVPSVFIAGTEDGIIHAYDTRNPRSPLTTNSDHLSSIRSLAFCPWSTNVLASAADDTSVRLFNLDLSLGLSPRFNPWSVYSDHTDYVRSVAWSPITQIVEGGVSKGKKIKGIQGHLISGSWDHRLLFHKVAIPSETKEGEIYQMEIEEGEEELETANQKVTISDDGLLDSQRDDQQYQ